MQITVIFAGLTTEISPSKSKFSGEKKQSLARSALRALIYLIQLLELSTHKAEQHSSTAPAQPFFQSDQGFQSVNTGIFNFF